LAGHLTLGRAVDLFLAAKAAEGVATKALEWCRMILRRAVGLGEDRPFEQLAGPEIRACGSSRSPRAVTGRSSCSSSTAGCGCLKLQG